MKPNNVIEKIKDVLNLNEEVKLEQQALENGTVLEADAFEADNEVFIVTEDERVAVPVGEYQLEDGRILVVAEEGIISEVKEAGEEEVEEEVEEVEAEEEEMAYATKQELQEVKEMIEEIKAMLEPKEDLSEDLGNLLTEELSKHELNEVPQEVQEELNEPSAEPIMANPEADSTNKPSFKFAQNRKPSTFDRVLNKIINN